MGTLSETMLQFLRACVKGRLNMLVVGGTGAGKTTTLNVLSQLIDPQERVITIEDAAELRLDHKHLVSLETRPPNIEGHGEITPRELVRNALRMRPDRIIIGEVRGEEAFELLQATNTGHDGSMSTLHANSCRDAVYRLTNMVLMGAPQLTETIIRQQIVSAFDVVVHMVRLPGGRRVISEIAVMDVQEPDFLSSLYVLHIQGRGEVKFVNKEVAMPVSLRRKLNLAGVESQKWFGTR